MKRQQWLWPYPQEISVEANTVPRAKAVKLTGESLAARHVADLEQIARLTIDDNAPFTVDVQLAGGAERPESFELSISDAGVRINGADAAGVSYAVECLLQLLVLSRGDEGWPTVTIRDWPAYRCRAAMVDMGRSVFSLDYLKRIVRIYSRLRFNQMHLRLLDDELCGIRFDGMPFGSENPYAITMDQFAELVRYAQDYHVDIVPELESWGHVSAITYHRPELRGGPGMYSGSSFLICEAAIDLLTQMTDQIVTAMPRQATIHLGFDEAQWFPDPSMGRDYQPADLLLRYDDMLQTLGAKHGKALTMQIWADHAGRPLHESIRDRVIIEPWMYWIKMKDWIDRAIGRYDGPGKSPWMMGVGQSAGQYRGAYHATRYFAKQAIKSENLAGLCVTLWGWNDFSRMMLSNFAGGYFAWNPFAKTDFAGEEDYESFDRTVFPIMDWWQSTFRDAYPDAIDADRGPLVRFGWYRFGDKHGQPVAPTVPRAGTLYEHDYLNEV
jgi:hypothetical protein